MDRKIVNVDLKAAREKAVATAKSAAQSARDKLAEKARFASAYANAKKSEAYAGLLERAVALSERQLEALRNARSKVS